MDEKRNLVNHKYASVDMNCHFPKTHRVIIREHTTGFSSITFTINAKGLNAKQIITEIIEWEKHTLSKTLEQQMFLGNFNIKTRTHSINIVPIEKVNEQEASFSIHYPHYSVTEIAEQVSMFLCAGKKVFRQKEFKELLKNEKTNKN